jgi:Flagellar motor switch protein
MIRPWLPPPHQSEIPSAIIKVVGTWLSNWLSHVPELVCDTCSASQASEAGIGGSAGPAFASSDCLLNLGFAALGGEGDIGHPRDRDLMIGLGRRIVTDLASSIKRLVPGVNQLETPQYWRLSAQHENFVIVLALSPDTLIELRKLAAGKARQARPASVLLAISGEVVALGGHLGYADLTAGELTTLEVGDVIALSRPYAEPVPVTINGFMAPGGHIKISPAAASLHLAVTAPIVLK